MSTKVGLSSESVICRENQALCCRYLASLEHGAVGRSLTWRAPWRALDPGAPFTRTGKRPKAPPPLQAKPSSLVLKLTVRRSLELRR